MAGSDRANGLIAFARAGHVYTLDPRTGEATMLAVVPSARGLSWSPDGSRIALETDPDGTGSQIAVLNVASGTVDVVTDDVRIRRTWVYGFEHPSWSPDGRRLAFAGSLMSFDEVCKEASEPSPDASMACFRASVFVFDLETGSVEQVTDGLGVDLDPTWAPDGSAIAFVRFRYPTAETPDPEPQMLLVDPDDGTLQRLLPPGTYGTDLSWSPDGHLLLFQDASGHLDILDLRTMRATTLVTAEVSDQELSDPMWSPDGRTVVFTRSVDAGETVVMIDAEGGPEHELAPGCCASWAPRPASTGGGA